MTQDWTKGGDAITYQRCPSCGSVWQFRRRWCPRCGSEPTTLVASGDGSVVAATTVRRAPSVDWTPLVPYVLILVDADEGFRMMAHGERGLAIGNRVHGRIMVRLGKPLPVFGRVDECEQDPVD